jgi:hypothetical protein
MKEQQELLFIDEKSQPSMRSKYKSGGNRYKYSDQKI